MSKNIKNYFINFLWHIVFPTFFYSIKLIEAFRCLHPTNWEKKKKFIINSRVCWKKALSERHNFEVMLKMADPVLSRFDTDVLCRIFCIKVVFLIEWKWKFCRELKSMDWGRKIETRGKLLPYWNYWFSQPMLKFTCFHTTIIKRI